MADMKKAYEMYKGGFSCGQIVATFCSKECGFDEKQARAGLAAFGGGADCGELCSAIVGGLYSLGMYCNQCEPGDTAASDKITAMTKKLTDTFKEKYGALRCEKLCASMDLHRCGEYISLAQETVERLIAEDKAK